MKNTRNKIIIFTLILILIAAIGILVARNLDQKKSTTESDKTSDSKTINSAEAKLLHKIQKDDIVLGESSAKVTVIEYASLSCPHCATFHAEGLPKLKAEYIDSGKVNFVHRDFPLNQPALVASMVAFCIAEDNQNDQVNQYYSFIKALFKTQDSWAFSDNFTEKLKSIAKLDGMSSEHFNSCIKDTALQERILKSRLYVSQTLQLQSTPTFIIGDKTINGYAGYDEIKKAVDQKLSAINSPKN